MPGNNRSAFQDNLNDSLRLSIPRNCSPGPKEYAVPTPVLLKGCPKQMYTATMHVGNQDFDVLADTGSSQLILFGEDCMGCSPGMKRYRPSVTSKDLRIKANTQYGGIPAGVYGDVYLDTVSVPGAIMVPNVSQPVPLALTSAFLSGFDPEVWALQNCSDASKLMDMPGILGLGNGPGGILTKMGLKTLGEDYYVQALIKAGMPGVISIQLCDRDGLLWLGGFDRKHSRTGKLPVYVPVRAQGIGYRVQVIGMSLGDPEQPLEWKDIIADLAIVDTGNRFLTMPKSAFLDFNKTLHSIYKDLIDSGKYDLTFPPDAPDCVVGLPTDPEILDYDLPELTVHLYKGPNETYPLRVRASRSYMVYHPANAKKTRMWCMEVDNTGPFVGGIGIPLLKNFVTVFDPLSGSAGCIGFVHQDPSTCPKAPVPPPPGPDPHPHPGTPAWPVWLIVLLCIAITLLCLAAAAWWNNCWGWGSRLRGQISWPQPEEPSHARQSLLATTNSRPASASDGA